MRPSRVRRWIDAERKSAYAACMTDQQTTVQTERAIDAADALADVLYTLNRAGSPFSIERTGMPYGDTKRALLAVLAQIYGSNTFARRVYQHSIDTAVKPSTAADALGMKPVVR